MLLKIIDIEHDKPVYISTHHITLVRTEEVQGVEYTAIYVEGFTKPFYTQTTIQFVIDNVNHVEGWH